MDYTEESQEEGVNEESQMSDSEFQETAALIPDGDYHKSPLFYGILDYLGQDRSKDYIYAEKVGKIVDFAVIKSRSNQIEDVLATIRALEDQMRPGLQGESRLDRLSSYVGILSKQQGLNEKFSKLLSAYEKPKMKKEDLPQNIQNRMTEKMTSLGECDLCETPMEIRDVRSKEKLCSKCQKLAPMIKRYQNYAKRGLTKSEKERILNSRTVAAGRRSYGK